MEEASSKKASASVNRPCVAAAAALALLHLNEQRTQNREKKRFHQMSCVCKRISDVTILTPANVKGLRSRPLEIPARTNIRSHASLSPALSVEVRIFRRGPPRPCASSTMRVVSGIEIQHDFADCLDALLEKE
jgi:hypothetical protein